MGRLPKEVRFVIPDDQPNNEFKKDTRLRVWLGVVYQDNLKPDWQRILENYMICCAVSPLHDQDFFDDDYDDGEYSHHAGDLKKPHYHIVFKFAGSKSFNQVWDILKELSADGRNPPPERPKSDTDHCVRYLIHYDHKDKAQYSRSDIVSICGFDVDRYFRINSEELDNLVCCLMDFCDSHKITDYYQLLQELRIARYDNVIFDELFRFSYSKSIFVHQYIGSRRNYLKEKKGEKKNDEELQ